MVRTPGCSTGRRATARARSLPTGSRSWPTWAPTVHCMSPGSSAQLRGSASLTTGTVWVNALLRVAPCASMTWRSTRRGSRRTTSPSRKGPRQTYGAFAQLLHAAIDPGISRAPISEAAAFLTTKSRPYPDAQVERHADDPLVLQAFGEMELQVRAAEALVAEAGRDGGHLPEPHRRTPVAQRGDRWREPRAAHVRRRPRQGRPLRALRRVPQRRPCTLARGDRELRRPAHQGRGGQARPDPRPGPRDLLRRIVTGSRHGGCPARRRLPDVGRATERPTRAARLDPEARIGGGSRDPFRYSHAHHHPGHRRRGLG